jgi:hypothetical protein
MHRPMTMTADACVAPASGRHCGGCTLCCKLLPVPAIDKPRGQLCRHCTPGRGCNIYRDRPGVCRDWNCGWQVWHWLGQEWYPLESGMVINPNLSRDPDRSAIDFHVDPVEPDRWRKPQYLAQLRELARAGLEGDLRFRVVINIDGIRKWIVLPDEEVEFNRFRKLVEPVEHRATCWRC